MALGDNAAFATSHSETSLETGSVKPATKTRELPGWVGTAEVQIHTLHVRRYQQQLEQLLELLQAPL